MMLCTFCNNARTANEAPCPHCGAPSPLITGANSAYGAAMQPPTTWGSPPPAYSNVQVSNQAQQVWPQSPQYPTPVQQQSPQFSPGSYQGSRLPVPYQPQQPLSAMSPGALTGEKSMILAPAQNLADLVSTLPEEAGAVYVPPMYTKPRPIIPTYRAISGLLSVLIVGILLCAGAGYYVKASGKLAAIGQFYGIVSPPNAKPAPTAPLANPTTIQQTGPAYGIINSATTTSRLNSQNVAAQPDTVFKPGQTIYLTYSVQRPVKPGIVNIKWYTNGLFYQSSSTPLISYAITGNTSQAYAQPAEGMVELYWNNQLAIRLYFVVR